MLGDARFGGLSGAAAAAAAGIVLVAGAWVSAGSAGAATVPKARVQADNLRFCANWKTMCVSSDTNHRTRVKVGTQLIWIYKDSYCDAYVTCPGHNVKLASHAATTTVKTDGAVILRWRFRHAGIYHYKCTHHASQGMTGTIVVYQPRT